MINMSKQDNFGGLTKFRMFRSLATKKSDYPYCGYRRSIPHTIIHKTAA